MRWNLHGLVIEGMTNDALLHDHWQGRLRRARLQLAHPTYRLR